jgi:DNA polymerase-1
MTSAPATVMPVISDWRDLPFREIWVIDFEFFPGAGLAHGGREGDKASPLCLVALEMRSGRVVRQWCDDFGPFPPYRLDADALIIGYTISAEFGCHIALGWGQPACALDPYVEFRHYVNDGAVKSGEREKGFYSLAGALQYFCEDGIDTAHKTDMRDRILQGPPFAAQERSDILAYCQTDVHALARLVPHIIPTIRSLPHALARARFMWAVAAQERRGVPLDLPMVTRIGNHWDAMRTDLVSELDRPFGCYEIVDGVAHWRKDWFAAYVRRQGMAWPAYEDGALDERDATFRDMEGKYPAIGPLRELRYSISKLRLNDLAVGSDGRNRTMLGAFGSKTGRNQPSNSRYVFGPAKWIRFLITPPPGLALIHRDYAQQEVRIAAVVSGDAALLQACESGDVYLGIAQQLGFAPVDATPSTHKDVRQMFKTVVLGIQYGLGARSLAVRVGISLSEAYEILARLRARFRAFESYAARVVDRAGLDLEIGTPFGWYMQCPSGINMRTVRNFPIQAGAAEIMRVVSILAERRGIKIVAPVHDAFMAEAPVDQAEDVSAALDRVMRDASAVVLRGYELPTDKQLIRPGQRYFDDRGEAMWNTVNRLLTRLEARTA